MNPTGGLILRRAEDRDREPLRRLAREIWPNRREDLLERRWWWSTMPKQSLVAVSNSGDVAAIVGERQCRVDADGRTLRATDICDWYVSPRFAGRGLGRTLVAQLMAQYDLLFTISISDAAVAGFTRLGWSAPSSVAMSLAPVAAVSRRIAAVLARPERDRFRVVDDDLTAASVGTELDDLWPRAVPIGTLAMVRDSAELRWRLTVVPRRHYRLLRCYKADILVGFMVARVIPPRTLAQVHGLATGVIVDFMVDRTNRQAFIALLARAMAWLESEGARVVLTLTTEPRFSRLLTQAGFVSPGTLIVGRALRRLRTRLSTVFPSEPGRAANWYVTLADSDLDFTLGADADPSGSGETGR